MVRNTLTCVSCFHFCHQRNGFLKWTTFQPLQIAGNTSSNRKDTTRVCRKMIKKLRPLSSKSPCVAWSAKGSTSSFDLSGWGGKNFQEWDVSKPRKSNLSSWQLRSRAPPGLASRNTWVTTLNWNKREGAKNYFSASVLWRRAQENQA